jgi:hypothetical protein
VCWQGAAGGAFLAFISILLGGNRTREERKDRGSLSLPFPFSLFPFFFFGLPHNRLLVPLGNVLPVDDLPDLLEVVGAGVLVLEVVGVLVYLFIVVFVLIIIIVIVYYYYYYYYYYYFFFC